MRFEYTVGDITKENAVFFVQKYHYSPVMPKLTKHFLGFFIDGKLKGVLTLGWGTQPKHTINKMFTGLSTKSYFEIGKMCMSEDMPRNSESQMLSHAVRWLKKKYPNLLFLYTLADGIMGKCGYVYQASNFLYGGKYFTQVYMMENGEKLHPRSTKNLLKENCVYSNRDKLFWMTRDFMTHKNIKLIEGFMFRYIYPLNNSAKKYIKNSNMKWTKEYPKDKDLKWFDKTILPKQEIKKPPFTFDNVIYNIKNVGLNSPSLEKFMA